MIEPPVEVCDADKPICPKCARVFRRIWVQDGMTYAFCDGPRRDGKPGVCGQHAAIMGEDGVAAVSPLSREVFATLKEHAALMLAMKRRIRRHLVAP